MNWNLKIFTKVRVMNNNQAQRIKEIYSDTHPGIGSYLECVTRAYGYGLAGFTLGNKNFILNSKN